MPRYQATFQETCKYVVEFNFDDLLDDKDETEWFEAMDSVNPNWFADSKTQLSVDDRELHELTIVAEPQAKEETT
jgi:hypothetical protein